MSILFSLALKCSDDDNPQEGSIKKLSAFQHLTLGPAILVPEL